MTALSREAHQEEGPVGMRRAWRRTGVLFALATLLHFALFQDTVESIVRIWMVSDTFSYGFLILPIVLFLAYQRRRQLAAVAPQPCFWALAWIAAALLLYLIGTVASATLLKQLAFVGLWQGLFALLAGWAAVRQMEFPLFFLVFAIPMGEEVIPLLQTITAEISVFLLRATGVPTFHSGVLIEIPSGSFVVADVCSGARFLITTVVLGMLAANLFFVSWRRRTIFVLLCFVVPILANGLRAYGIILLAHLTDHTLAIYVDHIVYGFIFLSLVLVVLTGVGALFRDRWGANVAVAPGSTSAPRRLTSSMIAFLLAAVLLSAGKAWSLQVAAPPATAGSFELAALQPGGGWRPAGLTVAAWDPVFPGADFQMLQAYQASQGEVALFIAHFLYQRDGHEIIAARNSFIGHALERRVTGFEKVEVVLGGGNSIVVQETVVRLASGPHIIWSWYDIGGRRTASTITGKLLEIWQALSGGSRSATAYAILTAVEDRRSDDRARLQAFLKALEKAEARPGS
jgi:exosortase A